MTSTIKTAKGEIISPRRPIAIVADPVTTAARRARRQWSSTRSASMPGVGAGTRYRFSTSSAITFVRKFRSRYAAADRCRVASPPGGPA